MRLAIILMTLGALAGRSSPVTGAVIEYEFSGVVTSVVASNNSFGALNLGDPFVANFVFDEASPDLLPVDSTRGRYSAISAFLQLPAMNIAQQGGLLDVTFDTLDFDSHGISFEIRALFEGAPNTFSSDALPTHFPPLSGLQTLHVLNVFSTSLDKFAGEITSAVIVPEPAAVCLFSLALLLIRRPR